MADRKLKGRISVEKVMDRLNESLRKYNEVTDTVLNQKVSATLDYDHLIEELDSAIKDVRLVAAVLSEEDIVIEDFEPFVKSLLKTEEAFLPILEGLARKANATGKYGWFTYRKDLKSHDELHREFQHFARRFGENIETAPGKSDMVSATAHILAVGADEVVIDTMEVPRDDYAKMKDENGIIYVMQGFEAGVPQYTILDKEMWKSVEASWIVPSEQREAQVAKMRADIFGE